MAPSQKPLLSLMLLLPLALATAARADADPSPAPPVSAPSGPLNNLEVTGGPSTLGLAGSNNAAFTIESIDPKGTLTGIGLLGGAFYQFFPGIQLGGKIGWVHTSTTGASVDTFLIMLGPTLNLFGDSLRTSYFLRALVGVDHNSFAVLSGPATNTDFVFEVEIGKRFALSDDISYVPSIGLIKTSSTNAQFNLVPLAVSLFFF